MRTGKVVRKTLETRISVEVNLDGHGSKSLATGIPFLEHMLDQVARHGLVDLTITAEGDLEIDAHHTVEDIGITLGQAIAQAVGDKQGIRRYGHVDFSGRPGLAYNVRFERPRVGDFDVDLFHEFFQGFVNHAQVTLHIDNLKGDNAHHQIETVFKAFGRAIRMALEPDPRMSGLLPSTKGKL